MSISVAIYSFYIVVSSNAFLLLSSPLFYVVKNEHLRKNKKE